MQPSLRRLHRFGVRPDHDLGQNFLVDSNVLGVIAHVAELERSDVVLEVGGGLGVLSEYLAARVAHVHVVEVDERLRDALGDALSAHANVSMHWGDAMRLPLAELEPAPGALVANLPYGIAASLLLRTIEELPSVTRWVAMVQREVGERLAAAPRSGAYGAPSVLAQLFCEVRVVRAVSRTVFRPVPNVDSVLIAMRRRARAPGEGGPSEARAREAGRAASEGGPSEAGPGEAGARDAEVRELVTGAFAHRRKTLARSLALSGAGAATGRSREEVRAALEAIGQPADARAERLSPQDFRDLAAALRA
jgi:16S rRNA (adenine1518-N6/adenine1519-N6)-dimethyltransferase